MPLLQNLIRPKYDITSNLKGGLNVSAPADQIPADAFQDIQNLQYVGGVLQVDSGYLQYGYRVAGNPLQPIQYELTNGDRVSCLVTTVAFYTWNTGLQDWVLGMTPIATTTVTDAVSGTPWTTDYASDYGPVIDIGGTGVTVGSLTGVSIGDVVSILCTNGRYFTSTVTSVNTGTNVVTFFDNLLPGYAIAPGAMTEFYTPYNGGAYSISWTVDPTTDALIWTNGVDPVQSFLGGTNAPLLGLYGNPTADPVVPPIATTARLLVRFQSYTIAIGTTEGGNYKPYRFRYSTPVSSTEWDPTVYAAAGFNDLTDSADEIVAVSKVGGNLVLGRESSIMLVSYWGTAYATWYFQYTLTNAGVLGGHGMEQSKDVIALVSESGVYGYIGDFSLHDIGDAIFNYMLGALGDLDPSNNNNLFLFYNQQYDEMWIFYPTVGNTYCNKILRFSFKYKNWHVRYLLSQIAGAGIEFNPSGKSWNQLIGTWQQQNFTWSQRTAAGNYPLILLAAYEDRVTYVYDYRTQTDNGAVIPWYLVTKDYPVLDQKLIFDGITAYGKGNNVLVELATSDGTDWATVGTMNFGTTFTKQMLDFQATSDFFRLRISGTDPNFQLSDLAPRYLEASEF